MSHGGRIQRLVDRGERAEALLIFRRDVGDDRIVEIIGGENLGAVGRPADAEFVEEIGGYFQQPGFDQHLVGGRVEFVDEFKNLREQMDVGRNQQRVAAPVRHDPDPAHQIADRPDGSASVRCRRAGIVAGSAEPGIISFFVGLLAEVEIALIGVGRLLLRAGSALLPAGATLALLLPAGVETGRTVSRKQNVQTAGNGLRTWQTSSQTRSVLSPPSDG